MKRPRVSSYSLITSQSGARDALPLQGLGQQDGEYRHSSARCAPLIQIQPV